MHRITDMAIKKLVAAAALEVVPSWIIISREAHDNILLGDTEGVTVIAPPKPRYAPPVQDLRPLDMVRMFINGFEIIPSAQPVPDTVILVEEQAKCLGLPVKGTGKLWEVVKDFIQKSLPTPRPPDVLLMHDIMILAALDSPDSGLYRDEEGILRWRGIRVLMSWVPEPGAIHLGNILLI